jgi:hypothetical protein
VIKDWLERLRIWQDDTVEMLILPRWLDCEYVSVPVQVGRQARCTCLRPPSVPCLPIIQWQSFDFECMLSLPPIATHIPSIDTEPMFGSMSMILRVQSINYQQVAS